MNGVRVFTALLSLTNRLGELRRCDLVATKAHSQYEHGLIQMNKSLTLYGNGETILVYMDNMSDKAFLESSFPSLRKDVVPIEKYGNLDLFSLPSTVQVTVLSEKSTINAALSTILDDVPIDESDKDLVIGFDAEWNVWMDGAKFTRGDIAVVQIAYEARVYILQVCTEIMID